MAYVTSAVFLDVVYVDPESHHGRWSKLPRSCCGGTCVRLVHGSEELAGERKWGLLVQAPAGRHRHGSTNGGGYSRGMVVEDAEMTLLRSHDGGRIDVQMWVHGLVTETDDRGGRDGNEAIESGVTGTQMCCECS